MKRKYLPNAKLVKFHSSKTMSHFALWWRQADRATLPSPSHQPDSICTFTCSPSLLCLSVCFMPELSVHGTPMSRYDESNICSSLLLVQSRLDLAPALLQLLHCSQLPFAHWSYLLVWHGIPVTPLTCQEPKLVNRNMSKLKMKGDTSPQVFAGKKLGNWGNDAAQPKKKKKRKTRKKIFWKVPIGT